MRAIDGLCQDRPPTAPRKLYKGLVQGQEYLKTGALDEMPAARAKILIGDSETVDDRRSADF